MTPLYLNQYPHIPLMDGDHDQGHHFHPVVLPTDQTSFISYPIIFNPLRAQETDTNTDNHHPNQQVQHRHELEFRDHLLIQGSSSFTSSSLDQSSPDDHPHTKVEDQPKPNKWMSSKMRIMRKMMSPDATPIKKPRRRKQAVFQGQQQPQDAAVQASSSSNNSPPTNGIVRVCSDCKTTKTPLWRSGPSGPKSLCNACGIRQRKARRAVAAAEAVRSGLIPAAEPSKVVKNKGSSDDADRTIPFKKRCRFNSAGSSGGAQKKKKKKQQLGFDDIVVSLSKSSAFHRVFPKDEKDAAILLMALSCGLMCS